MSRNIIILTGGLSGSSVLSHLISKEGFWLGDSIKEINYKTFENSQLVDLNIKILNSSGYSWKDVMDIPPPSAADIENTICMGEKDFTDFIEKCEDNAPWLWKDPRLCYTLPFWKKFIPVRKCKFILISRDIRQSWTGIVLRGKMPISYKDLKTIEWNCLYNAKEFLNQEKIEYLGMTFEDLMMRPENTLETLNKFLGLSLNMDHLKAVYKGRLGRLRWSRADFVKAQLKYACYKYVSGDHIDFPRKRKGEGSGLYKRITSRE